MKERLPRRTASAAETLPDDLKAALDRALAGPGTQTAIAAGLSEELAKRGLPPISRLSVHRYDRRMRATGERMRRADAAAAAVLKELGESRDGEVGRLVSAFGSTLVFDGMSRLADMDLDEELPAAAKILSALTLSHQRLERTRSANIKATREALALAAERIAAAAEKEAAASGGKLSVAQVRSLIRGAYGVQERPEA